MSTDPTPGDPDQIDQLAREYEEIRDDAQTALRVLGRGGSLSRARGDSMTKLRDMLDSLPGKLQRTVNSFDTAAQAYRTYARILRDQQTRIDTAMDQAGSVASIARAPVPRAAATATVEERTAILRQANDVLEAQSQTLAARRLAEDARRLREAASARCNRELDDAAAQAIKPPPRRNFFQRIGDFFRNNPIARLIVDILIAVVAVVLPVVGLVLAAVSVVVTAVVQAANGNFELGTLLVGLVSLVPAAVLFGPVVKFAGKAAPQLAVTVRGSGKAFGELADNAKLIKGATTARTGAVTFARNTTKEFTQGVVEEVATVGLNKAANKDADGFNAASIFAGAAAGAAVNGGIDGFRKSFDAPDTDIKFERTDRPDAPVGAGGTAPEAAGSAPAPAGLGGGDTPATSGPTSDSSGAPGDTPAGAGAASPEPPSNAPSADPSSTTLTADPTSSTNAAQPASSATGAGSAGAGTPGSGVAGVQQGTNPLASSGVTQQSDAPAPGDPAVTSVPASPAASSSSGGAQATPGAGTARPAGQQPPPVLGSADGSPPAGSSSRDSASAAPAAAVPAGSAAAVPAGSAPAAPAGSAAAVPAGSAPATPADGGADGAPDDGELHIEKIVIEAESEASTSADEIRERAADAAQDALAAGAEEATKAAVEDGEDDDPGAALLGAAAKAGAVLAAGERFAGEGPQGFPRKSLR
ncbi:hypothetical protein [Paractinoplanes hotanensis]|uniref:Uncharacterized protein n=1 Tax=Paractinoplanes hotanensis TaxID=2906497 RepID=A0ABT0YCL6_9ACTN|nr:hypothetical protein [Actinoplanes hotanensis]MCM4083803.1 hypothetical protein [Actinoplanes hotanensis]